MTQEIIAIEMSDGDPAFFVRGHVEIGPFVARVNVEFDGEYEVGDAKHTYMTETIPARFVGKYDKPQFAGDPYWWHCEPDDPGAFPVTEARP